MNSKVLAKIILGIHECSRAIERKNCPLSHEYKTCDHIPESFEGLRRGLDSLTDEGVYIAASTDMYTDRPLPCERMDCPLSCERMDCMANFSVTYDKTVLMFGFGETVYFQYKNNPITNLKTDEIVPIELVLKKIRDLAN